MPHVRLPMWKPPHPVGSGADGSSHQEQLAGRHMLVGNLPHPTHIDRCIHCCPEVVLLTDVALHRKCHGGAAQLLGQPRRPLSLNVCHHHPGPFPHKKARACLPDACRRLGTS